jgi:two-component system response regulator HydG
VIIVTGQGGLDNAVAAIRAGAYDFVTKPIRIEELRLILGRSVQYRKLQREVKRLREATQSSPRMEGLVGESQVMASVYELIRQLGDSDSSVLITGESGTGKELIAHAVHNQSSKKGPFIAINCAAMPATLLESELFGHVRGAFTDAKKDRQGLFLKADGGTLFLDEIGEMPAEMQAKLLRVLQERKVRPIGGDKEVSFDTRIVSATNRDLSEEVSEKRFREDLFYRINVITIDVPPLRSRGGDILLLAQFFINKYSKKFGKDVTTMSPEAATKIRDFNWPGNVRELENCIERAVTLTKFSELGSVDLPESIQNFRPRSIVIDGDDPELFPTLTEMETRYIERVLEAVDWNKSKAARTLGVDRRTLYRKMERLEIKDPS